MPDAIGNFSKLENLKLSHCIELVSLPDTIGKLRYLKKLFISDGQITSLPESIGDIVSLKELELLETNIASLPDSIGNLINLEFLGVWGIPLSDMARVLLNITTEKKYPFAVLPTGVSKLVSLRFLTISNTEVTKLPDLLGDLPVLRKIEAVNCNIKAIPVSIQRKIDSKKLTLIRTEKEFFNNL